MPLTKHGGDRKTIGDIVPMGKGDQGSVRTLVRGETSDYLLRRMARDNPEIVDQLKAGLGSHTPPPRDTRTPG